MIPIFAGITGYTGHAAIPDLPAHLLVVNSAGR